MIPFEYLSCTWAYFKAYRVDLKLSLLLLKVAKIRFFSKSGLLYNLPSNNLIFQSWKIYLAYKFMLKSIPIQILRYFQTLNITQWIEESFLTCFQVLILSYSKLYDLWEYVDPSFLSTPKKKRSHRFAHSINIYSLQYYPKLVIRHYRLPHIEECAITRRRRWRRRRATPSEAATRSNQIEEIGQRGNYGTLQVARRIAHMQMQMQMQMQMDARLQLHEPSKRPNSWIRDSAGKSAPASASHRRMWPLPSRGPGRGAGIK